MWCAHDAYPAVHVLLVLDIHDVLSISSASYLLLTACDVCHLLCLDANLHLSVHVGAQPGSRQTGGGKFSSQQDFFPFFFVLSARFFFSVPLRQALALLWLRVTMVFIPRELADIKDAISPHYDGDNSAGGGGGGEAARGQGGRLREAEVSGLCPQPKKTSTAVSYDRILLLKYCC